MKHGWNRIKPKEEKSEMVFGVVAPIGVNVKAFEKEFSEALTEYGYESGSIQVSKFISETQKFHKEELKNSPELARISTYMNGGLRLREKTETNAILAIHVAAEIYRNRPEDQETKSPMATPGKAYFIRSLKTPEEVELLKKIYGDGFFLIGLYSPEPIRKQTLIETIKTTELDAQTLINRDKDENEEHGQNTTDAFHLADVFIDMSKEKWQKKMRRFLHLVFSSPFMTPTMDEYAMYLAFSSALRSADLSRQVGAVICSSNGDIIGCGANDVPCFDGGQYWPDLAKEGSESTDRRDHSLGFDKNAEQKDKIIAEVITRLQESGFLKSNLTKIDNSKIHKSLKDSRLGDITEFIRSVHAEMEALLNCARSGVSPRGGTLYSTTYPCHNCAKHIIGAGIRRVVFVQPYPKSLAMELHGDSIFSSEEENNEVTKELGVVFEAFEGIGPSRFFDLFSIAWGRGVKLKRKQKNGIKAPLRGLPRLPMLPESYIEKEARMVREIGDLLRTGDN